MIGENTRERILYASFVALSESYFTGMSLADIARRCNITKTAIYRHFENKEALLASMKERFFDVLLTNFNMPVRDFFSKQSGLLVISFFSRHPEYLNFFIYSMVESPNFEQELAQFLKQQDVITDNALYIRKNMTDRQKIRLYLRLVYGATTAAYYISEMQDQGGLNQFPVFPEKLYKFFINGWNLPCSLSAERRQELNKICLLLPGELPEKSRIFEALAAVVAKYGFPGVTVERISGALGMAKSSLYSYFSNKSEMMTKLIDAEILGIVRFFSQRADMVENVVEAIYVQMRLLTVYLLARPAILSVLGWLRSRGYVWNCNVKGLMNSLMSQFVSDVVLPDLDIPLTIDVVSNWVSMVPVSIIIQCLFHDFKDEQVFDSVEIVFDFIMKGVGEVK